jgi:sugar lactone lactonase YvrE
MFNDGEVDPQGRFMAATKVVRGGPIRLEPREATLFRIGGDKGGEVQTVLEGLTIPNGIGFTGDGKTM